jgi:hypothetical protein
VITARYDGQAEWCEAFASGELFDEARRAAVRLLGGGPGQCLDLGCGTGVEEPGDLDPPLFLALRAIA